MREDRAIGYISVDLDDKGFPKGAQTHPELTGFGHIAKIGVIPAEQGREGALALLRAAELWLQSQGTKGAWLDYLPHRRKDPNRHPYHLLGYTDVDEFLDSQERTRRIAAKKW